MKPPDEPDSIERELKRRFSQLRGDDARLAPSFSLMLARAKAAAESVASSAPHRIRLTWPTKVAALGTVAALGAVLFLLVRQPTADRAPDLGIRAAAMDFGAYDYVGMTDFLAEIPDVFAIRDEPNDLWTPTRSSFLWGSEMDRTWLEPASLESMRMEKGL